MIRHEIEKKYIENGLNDFRLRTIEDIKLCHGIDIEAVKGYEELTEENKAIYRNAMLNIHVTTFLVLPLTIFKTKLYYFNNTYLIQNTINIVNTKL